MDRYNKLFYSIFIFIFTIYIVQIKADGLSVKITDVNVESDKEYVTIKSNIRNVGDDVLVDIEADLLKDLGKNVYVQSNALSKMNGEYHTLIKTDIVNMCEFLENPSKEPFMEMFYENIKNSGNILEKCPLTKGHYYLKGFKINPANLPEHTPIGDFRVEVEVFYKDTTDKYKQLYKLVWSAAIQKK